MIDFDIDTTNRIVRVRPDSTLEEKDFAALAAAVDPVIAEGGDLAGLIIDVAHFPGWDGFAAMVTHVKFVHDHERHVKKIAVVTDSPLGGFAEHLVSHFVSAEIRRFPATEVEQAKRWIVGEASVR
jgi:N-acetylglucosamine kinase-like BadF-type ATPase